MGIELLQFDVKNEFRAWSARIDSGSSFYPYSMT